MNSSNKPRPSIFQKATALPPQSFQVEIDINDVRQVRPDWDEQRAMAFLTQHSQQIAAQMLEAGMTAVISLASGSEHAN